MFSGFVPRSPEIRGAKSTSELPLSSQGDCPANGWRETGSTHSQGNIFMAALSSLFGSSAADVERKRRHQEEIASALHRQIEEKRRQTHGDAERYGMNAVAEEASHILIEMQEKFKPSQTQPLKVTFSEAGTSASKKLYAESLPAPLPSIFTINTESPFEHSKVATPPLGFSMRKSMPTSDFLEKARGNEAAVKRPGFRFLAQENFKGVDLPRGGVELEADSEFIYPDGHVSRTNSRK